MTQVSYHFDNTNVLIVGATSGIGKATAVAFSKAGANLMLAGLVCDGSEQFMSELKANSKGAVHFLQTDVTDENQVADLINTTIKEFTSIDVAINNAGTEGKFGPIHEMSSQEFDRLVSTNLRGTWLCMKYEIPHLHKNSVIINMASTAGVQSIPMVGVYSATKHGIIGLTKGAALELAEQGIRVNAIAPGPVDTGLLSRMVNGQVPIEVIADSVPLKRIAQPEEIANAIMWLASDGSSYVTGETLMIDGGVTQA